MYTEQDLYIQRSTLSHLSYTVTNDDLISNWIEMYHRVDHILVVHEPIKHINYLRDSGLIINDMELYSSSILTIQLSCMEDGIWLLKTIPIAEGPYVQLWSMGQYISDNEEK
mgnify:CR=1 FL=1|jgi:hypothetical protein